MFYSVNSSGLLGLSAYPVRAEVDFSQSMPAFEIVGLPGTAVKESRDRVRSAIRNCGFAFPVGKIIVNLSPADVKKELKAAQTSEPFDAFFDVRWTSPLSLIVARSFRTTRFPRRRRRRWRT